MIAHVAELGEDRGRVVLQVSSAGRLSEIAVEAAVRIAQAFQSEIESLFVEDIGLFDGASYPFSREIAHSGRTARSLTAGDLEHELRGAARHLQKRIADMAGRAEVPLRCRTMREGVEVALSHACAQCGPWNMVALGEPLDAVRAETVGALLQAVHGTTGVVLAGPHARRTEGPVVALIEDAEHVPPMLRAAERIAAVTGGNVRLLVVASGPIEAGWLEGQVRLVLEAEAAGTALVSVAHQAEPRALAAHLIALRAGFVFAQYGGIAVPGGRELAALAAGLEGPLVLVR